MSHVHPVQEAQRIEDYEQEIERNLQIQTALNSILRISLEPLSLDEQLQGILDLILDLLWLAVEAKGCIYLVEGVPPRLVMRAHAGIPQVVQSSCAQVPFGKCLCGRSIAANHLLVADRVTECHEILYPGITPHGHCCVPIASGDRRIGLLNLNVSEGHWPSPEEEQFLRAVADVLAGVIEHKRVEESLRRSEERFDLAVRGTEAGIWDWDLRTDEVYFSAHWKSMLGYAEDEVGGHFAEWEARLHPEDRERAAATMRDYLGGRTPDYELEHRLRHKDGSYRWLLARGAMVRDQEGRPYRMVGSHLDITERKKVDVKLREREASLIASRRILDRLLPHVPLRSQGFLIQGTCFAADYVPGDYFDYFLREDGSILVVVADVSGHGIEAALMMASAHARLRSLAELPLGIDKILDRMNTWLFDETAGDSFVTVMMLQIDPRSRTLVYSNAGHPPAFVISESGELKSSLESLCLPLALQAEVEFSIGGPVTLDRGDLVLLVTDGIIETRSAQGIQFGIERMLQVVRERVGSPPEEILDSLQFAVRNFAGTCELHDDETIVLVKPT